MLRSVRHKFRMIRYYSAPRQQSAWSSATDFALIISLALALPAAWICDQFIVRTVEVASISGQIFPADKGGYEALLVTTTSRTSTRMPQGVPVGNFQVILTNQQKGWPLTTTQSRLPARIDVDIRTEPRPRLNAQLALDDPLRIAITDVLEQDKREDALSAWLAPEEAATKRIISSQARPLAWLFGASIWWILLSFCSVIIIQLVRVGWMLMHGRRLARREHLRTQGKCLTCGYDMRGLEFNERCPECGELVW